jgi:mannose-6-phosphate isomerase
MHLFEALLEARAAAPELIDQRLHELYRLFSERFFVGGLLYEFFGAAWERSEEFGSGRLDPGHMCEWVWLLDSYSRLSGFATIEVQTSLLQAARALGRVNDQCFLVDEASITGRPLKNSSRLWPQAEQIKAFVVAGRNIGSHERMATANQIAEAVLARYLSHTPRGTWRDNFDLGGQPIATTIPSSSLYHLHSAALVVDDATFNHAES